jgi:hypothetical protein
MSARGSPLLPPVPSGELSELRLWVDSGPLRRALAAEF